MVPAALALSLATHTLTGKDSSGFWAFARDPLESLAYSGDALSLFIPWPLRVTRFEGDARFGVMAVIAVFVSVGVLVWFASGFRGSRPKSHSTTGSGTKWRPG